VEAFNQHDLDYVASRHAEGALHHQQGRLVPLRGRDEIREDYRRSPWVPFPDFQFELERAFGQGEWLCVQETLTGTYKGPLEGPGGETIPATGRAIRVPICFVVRVDGGKAVEVYEYNDQLGFLAQLGLAPQLPRVSAVALRQTVIVACPMVACMPVTKSGWRGWRRTSRSASINITRSSCLNCSGGLRQPLRRSNSHDCSSALELLPIQRDQRFTQLFCQSDINCIRATDPMLSSYRGSLLGQHQCDWDKVDHF
jgi:predicted ester cyclase